MTILDGRIVGKNVRVIDVLHHMRDNHDWAATAAHYGLTDEEMESALSWAIAHCAYVS